MGLPCLLCQGNLDTCAPGACTRTAASPRAGAHPARSCPHKCKWIVLEHEQDGDCSEAVTVREGCHTHPAQAGLVSGLDQTHRPALRSGSSAYPGAAGSGAVCSQVLLWLHSPGAAYGLPGLCHMQRRSAAPGHELKRVPCAARGHLPYPACYLQSLRPIGRSGAQVMQLHKPDPAHGLHL